MHRAEQEAEYDLLMRSQFWPPAEVRELQRERLGALLRHAQRHVPFYGDRLAPLIRRDGEIDWSQWDEVPILRRSDLIEHRRRLLARTVPVGHGQIIDVSTSGSTGTPVITSHTSLALHLSEVAVFRAADWHDLDYAKRLGSWDGEHANEAAWPEGRVVPRWGPAWMASATGRQYVVNRHTHARDVLEFFARREVDYVMGGATDMRLLAYEAQRSGATLKVDAAFTRSADVTEEGRKLLKDVFGARTFELYSSREAHRMAHLCPYCGNWHVNDEQVLLEVLDEVGRPSPPGQPGRVVVTPFRSFAEPLIRYEQGDIAVRAARTDCKRQLSSLSRIVGRVKHMFVMPDGARVVPWLPPSVVAALNATQFQIAQVGRDMVEVRYVPRAADAGPDRDAVTASLRALMHPDLVVSYVERPGFTMQLGRKHLEFVNESVGT